ncbi:MAG: zinc ABC transporter substrate-binding protein [Xanthobacteraceae bacterium]
MKALIAFATFAFIAAGLVPGAASGGRIAIVAAENFYGDVARQIGGDRVEVDSILRNPAQDPHLFEASPSDVRAVAGAQIVIYNGADYDPWMAKLVAATRKGGRTVIVAAALTHKNAGDNPHLWYDPSTMPVVAAAIASALSAADPAHKADYAARLQRFTASLAPLDEKIATIRKKYAGAAVAATEPVFGAMATALDLKMHDRTFQIAVMNDTEPSARALAAFEHELKTHAVRVLFYNEQASNNLVRHLLDLARASKIPVVGVTETEPPGRSYQDWMMSELDATERALAGTSS